MESKSREELLPPCAAACPVGTDARRYVGLIFQGRYEEAMEVIKANNVIASVCAYICNKLHCSNLGAEALTLAIKNYQETITHRPIV